MRYRPRRGWSDGGESSNVNGSIHATADRQPGGGAIFDSEDPLLIIGPGATVKGELRFERKVKTYVSDKAIIGPLTGATAVPFSGDSAPARPLVTGAGRACDTARPILSNHQGSTMPSLRVSLGFAAALMALAGYASVAAPADPALATAIASPERKPAHVARDTARHPAEELTFFGVTPKMTVVELWPGGGYWTDILGPYLAPAGKYYLALPMPGNAEEDAGVARFRARLAEEKNRFGTIHETALGAGHFEIAPPGSADLVVTFRNLHNWMDDGYAEQALAACFTALKPGGILGIEEHRGRNDVPQDPKAKNGYVRQDYAIALAKKVGFVLVASSEINANPRDTKDWVDGVWTLPPTLSQGEKDRAKYVAVGEADNFVLKFQKPR